MEELKFQRFRRKKKKAEKSYPGHSDDISRVGNPRVLSGHVNRHGARDVTNWNLLGLILFREKQEEIRGVWQRNLRAGKKTKLTSSWSLSS